MTKSRKTKLSISLSQDLLVEIDHEARRRRESRSAVIESWLRSAAARNAEATLASEVIAYYDARSAEERREDERMAKALTTAARKIDHQDASETGRRGVASPAASPKRRR